MFKSLLMGSAAALLLITAVPADVQAAANDQVAPMQALAKEKIQSWIANPVVINAIKAQNAAHASLSQGDIDKMDKQWRAETKSGSKPLINKVLATELSAFLKKIQDDSKGLYTEIFVMDNKGLNVGQSAMTSDYWQGDEAKWQKTFQAGPGAIHIGKVSQDESTQRFQSQLSMAITDPATHQVIGAVTIGVDVESLLH